MQKYLLEFILHAQNTASEVIRNSLAEFAEGLEIHQDINTKGKDFRVLLRTDEPTVIFDICSQLGRIRKIKVNEVK